MWAPWRIGYVESGVSDQDGCLFCRIAQSDDNAANLVLYRAGAAMVMMNLYPYNSGHLIIVPYAHQASPEDLASDQLEDVWRLMQLSLGVVRRVLHPQGFNLGANLGAVAGAGIPDHFHMHLVPRWSGDTNFMPVLDDVKVIPEHLEQTYHRLRISFDAI